MISITQRQRIKNLGTFALKGAIPWNKNKKEIYSKETLTKMGTSQKERFKKENIWNKGITGYSTSKKGKKMPNFSKENHPLWKGENAGYRSKHIWIQNHYGSKKECEFCGDISEHRYHWANISGWYKRERKDWFRLCPKCHGAFDKGRRLQQKGRWLI